MNNTTNKQLLSDHEYPHTYKVYPLSLIMNTNRRGWLKIAINTYSDNGDLIDTINYNCQVTHISSQTLEVRMVLYKQEEFNHYTWDYAVRLLNTLCGGKDYLIKFENKQECGLCIHSFDAPIHITKLRGLIGDYLSYTKANVQEEIDILSFVRMDKTSGNCASNTQNRNVKINQLKQYVSTFRRKG